MCPGRPPAWARIWRTRWRSSELLGEEQDGVEIALHRNGVAESGPAFIQRHAPIEADHIGSGLAHGRQQGRGIHAEVDDRHAQRLHLVD